MCGLMDDAILGPDGRPASFDGAVWVSQDGRYWWNGATWQPVVRRRRFRVNGFVVFMGLVCLGILVFIGHGVYDAVTSGPAPGVSNARIDNLYQIEFDYARAAPCHSVTFTYLFYGSNGKKLSTYDDATRADVPAHRVFHVTVSLNAPLDPSANRFDALDACHD